MALVDNEAALYKPRAAVYRPPTATRPRAAVGARNPSGGGVAPPPAPGTPKGTSIPGAGIYLAKQALAQRAFEQANKDIQYRRGQMYQEFGLLPNGQVDPNAQYGRYQQMLGQDAGQLHGAQIAARARGLGNNTGLGARLSQAVRNAQGAEHFGFQQTLLNNLHTFDQEGLAAKNQLDASMLDAEQEQVQWALDHPDVSHPAGVPGTQPGGSGGPAKPPAPQRTAVPARHNVAAARAQLARHLRTVRTRRRVA